MNSNNRRAVFLDRDGVINRAIVRNGQPFSPASVEEVALLPDVNEACQLLKKNGFHLVVVTNQPEVGRGTVDQKSVEEIHRKISESLPIDRIEVCYDSDDSSEFRKPNPGMLKRAARELDVDLERSFMVGDRWRDVDCGHTAGCQTIFIDHGFAERLRKTPHYRAKNLLEAARLIVDFAAAQPKITSPVQTIADLKIKIFADGADKATLLALNADTLIKGMTTNPTLMKKAGISNYEKFAHEVLSEIKDKPISFEVFSDEFPEMRRQALKISQWQKNVYVKIPVTNTRAEPSLPLIAELAEEGVRLNITAILTTNQVRDVVQALDPKVPSVVSVFAGRIADTGRDPMPIMKESLKLVRQLPNSELLWASVREVLNVVQAELCGCDIVTVPPDILKKARSLWQKDLAELSLDTVKMFADDAIAAGFEL